MTLLVKSLTVVTILLSLLQVNEAKRFNEVDVTVYREKVKKMFYHAYDSYLKYAYPYDELQPLTCKGFDTWGSYSLTLIDALDTLAVIGNHSEFRRIANIVIEKGETIFDMDINVSVFETNIRIVGGLLSAHLLMKRTGMQLEPAWPCSGPLLRMAESIARRLLPAFDTPTGMPYGTVNLRFGVPKGETTITCTAGVGTFIVEFGTLSRLTGDPIFEKTAIRAIRSLWKFKSSLGLLGNHIDVKTGKWTALDSGIGGGVDSYFEYLVKGSILFNLPELVYLFRDYEEPIKKYLKRDDWYMWAHMTKGTITLPMFTSLDAFWPGIQALLGDIEPAMKTIHNFHQVWRQFGATPEYYNIPKAEAHKGREGYPLRPELIESIMYLYRATKDPVLLEMGVDIVEAIERTARTNCGYATVKDVQDHRIEDRMESFFLAETTKYLYLLFDPDNFIHNNGSHGTHITTPSGSCIIEAGGYVFNTEAHPIDLASVYCCSAEKQEEDRKLEVFHDNLDLLTLTGLIEDVSELEDLVWSSKERRRIQPDNKDEFEGEEEDSNVEPYEDNKILDANLEGDMDKDFMRSGQVDDTDESTERDNDNQRTSDKIRNTRDENHGHILEVLDESTTQREIEELVHQGKTESCFDEGEACSEEGKNKYFKQSEKLEAIDLTGLSDIERDLAKDFLEQLNLDSDMVDFSLEIGRKMGSDFKGTEFEKVAEFISRQMMQIKTVNVKEKGEPAWPDEYQRSTEETKHTGEADDDVIGTLDNAKEVSDSQSVKYSSSEQESFETDDKNDVDEEESGGKYQEFQEKTTIASGKENTQTEQQVLILPEGTLSKDVKDDKQSSQSADEKVSNQKETPEMHQMPALEPALQKLKDHLEAQLLQQYKQSNLKEAAKEEGRVSNLESKRANILSLTTKLFKLFARRLTGGGSDDDDSGKSPKPSIAGLYKSLAGYPLQYFHDPHMMHCPAQPFHSRISVYGEMFEER